MQKYKTINTMILSVIQPLWSSIFGSFDLCSGYVNPDIAGHALSPTVTGGSFQDRRLF